MFASQKARRKSHGKVLERIKQLKWGNSCKSMWIRQLWNTGHIPYSELAGTLFPFESTNNIKIKGIRHRVTGDGCIGEGTSVINTSWVSQLVLHQVLKCSQP